MDKEKENIVVGDVTVESCSVNPTMQQAVEDTAQAMNDTMASFDEPVADNKEQKTKGFLDDFKNFIGSKLFKDKVEKASNETGIPKKVIAQNFFERALGTVGDMLGVAISTVCNAGRLVISIAGTVANGIVNIIETIAKGIASFITGNKTCVTE